MEELIYNIRESHPAPLYIILWAKMYGENSISNIRSSLKICLYERYNLIYD